jgi:hypothetical protein
LVKVPNLPSSPAAAAAPLLGVLKTLFGERAIHGLLENPLGIFMEYKWDGMIVRVLKALFRMGDPYGSMGFLVRNSWDRMGC